MEKRTVTYKCGHQEEREFRGAPYKIDAQVKYLEQRLCKACWAAQQNSTSKQNTVRHRNDGCRRQPSTASRADSSASACSTAIRGFRGGMTMPKCGSPSSQTRGSLSWR